MSEVVLYKSKKGDIKLDVNLTDESVWLSLQQLSKLFGRDKSVISRHINNIFKIKELKEASVVAKFATTAQDGKTYQVEYYNLDAIISVGYRVNSKEAVLFRQWASSILKEHLIRGFTIRQERVSKRGISELEQTIQLLHKTLINNQLVSEIGSETIQLIIGYAKTWHLLLAYDENRLQLPIKSKPSHIILDYDSAVNAILALKNDLMGRNEASPLFGTDREKGLENILLNIEQSFDDQPIYPTVEERASNLIYFIIKNHPFVDGNKRIGCLIFLLYLRLQKVEIKINENGLVSLALLIAESDPKQKDMMVRLVVNLLLS